MSSSQDTESPRVFVGRQPIFDRSESIFGYELLFRGSDENDAVFGNPDAATEDLLHTALVDIGLEHLVGSRRVFLNVTPVLAKSRLLLMLPAAQSVLEFGSALVADEPFGNILTQLKQDGFQVAFSQSTAEQHPDLVPLVDYIKVDTLDLNPVAFVETSLLRNLPAHVKLIATRVENPEIYEQCQHLPFDYFQGFFLSYPNVVEGRRVQTHQVVLLQILQAVQSANTSLDDLAALVTKAPGLVIALLRVINSARFRRPHPIESIRQAINLLGRDEIGRWALLLSLRSASPHEHAVEQVLIRARFATLLAPWLDTQGDDEPLFLLGLLSAIDRLLGLSLPEILQQMRIEGRIRDALLDREGEFEPVLEVLDAFENWSSPPMLNFPTSTENLSRRYLEAVAWSRECLAELSEAL